MASQIEPPLCYTTYQKGRPIGTTGKPQNDDTRSLRLHVLVDSAEVFESKPTKNQVAAISRRIMKNGCAHGVTPEELAQALSLGCSIMGGVCIGRRSPDCWKLQMVWCIDVDNDPAMMARGWKPLSYADALRRAFSYGLPLLISYKTFSSDPDPFSPPERERYRLLFARARPTRDRAEAERFGAALLAAYPEADKTTTQLNRIFYGTDKEVLLWHNTTIR